MIEPAVRNDLLRGTLADADVAVLLLDLVIGFGVHADPAREIARLCRKPRQRGHVVASVTGTDADTQGRAARPRH